MVLHSHPAIGGLDLVVGSVGGDAEDRVGGLVILPVEHRDDGVDIRIVQADHGSDGLQDRFFGLAEVPVSGSNLHQVMEQLQPLGIVHIVGYLGAYGVYVDLLAVESVQHAHRLVYGGIAEIAADEFAHAVELGLRDLSVGFDDGRRQDQEADEEAVALFVSGIAAAGRRAVAARLLLIAAGAAGVTAVAASPVSASIAAAGAGGAVSSGSVSEAAARQLAGDIYELFNGRAQEVSEKRPYGPAGYPAQKTTYPPGRTHLLERLRVVVADVDTEVGDNTV